MMIKKIIMILGTVLILSGCSISPSREVKAISCPGEQQSVSLNFDSEEKLIGMNITRSVECESISEATKMQSQSAYYAKDLGLPESCVTMSVSGRFVNINIAMTKTQLQDSLILPDADLGGSKEEIIAMIEESMDVTCEENE